MFALDQICDNEDKSHSIAAEDKIQPALDKKQFVNKQIHIYQLLCIIHPCFQAKNVL